MPQVSNYGPVGLEQVFAERLTTINSEQQWQVVTNFAQMYDEYTSQMLSVFTQRTTTALERVMLPATGSSHQPLDDKGNPMPTFPSGYADTAYPIQGGGSAVGDNRVSRALMTPQELARLTVQALYNDQNWLFRHVLAALFTNTSWTFTDPQLGSLTIRPLAITADGIIYPFMNGTTGTDQHYLAQAAAIDNVNDPFPIIAAELSEHPGNNVSSATPIIVYAPTNLIATIRALTAFVPVTPWFIKPGSNDDVLVGADGAAPGPGVLIGTHTSNVLIKEWNMLPDNYMIAVATGGGAPLGWREYPASDLQGLITEEVSVDGNRRDRRFIRYAGFGARNRVAALAYRIGNAAYAIPTGYTAPLAA